jgi:hypothetical protein
MQVVWVQSLTRNIFQNKELGLKIALLRSNLTYFGRHSSGKFELITENYSRDQVYQRVNKPPGWNTRALERTDAWARSSVKIIAWIEAESL